METNRMFAGRINPGRALRLAFGALALFTAAGTMLPQAAEAQDATHSWQTPWSRGNLSVSDTGINMGGTQLIMVELTQASGVVFKGGGVRLASGWYVFTLRQDQAAFAPTFVCEVPVPVFAPTNGRYHPVGNPGSLTNVTLGPFAMPIIN